MIKLLCKIDIGGGITRELGVYCKDSCDIKDVLVESCHEWLCDDVIDYDSVVEVYDNNGHHVYNVMHDIDYNDFEVLEAE